MEVNQLIVWFAWYQQENITFLIWEETWQVATEVVD